MSAPSTDTPAPPGPNAAARRIGIAVAVVVGGLVALNLLASGVDRAVGGREPSGVAGSSYGTQAAGLGGFASLLTHYGYPVARERGALSGAALDPATTEFVIEPQTLTDSDDASLLEVASQGGRLVIGGTDPFYLARLRDRPPVWTPSGAPAYAALDPSLGRLRRVETAGTGAWSSPGSGVVLAHAGDAGLLTRDRVGHGAMYFLADASPIENAYLARADNAAFALGLAGAAPRGVVFVEGVHGYGERSGLGAIPTPWKVALIVLAFAAAVFAWSRGRRFGPPDRPARELLPARAEYVGALAVSLERARDPAAALAPLQEWARAQIARRAHVRPDASAEELDRAAIRLGCSESERAALRDPATGDAATLALGRLAARLSQTDGSTT